MPHFPSSPSPDKRAGEAGTHAAQDSPVRAEVVLEVVRALYAQLHRGRGPGERLAVDSALERDLGFDSLARVELLRRLEDRLRLRVPQSALNCLDTVSAVLRACGAADASSRASADMTRTRAAAGAPPPITRVADRVKIPVAATTVNEVLDRHADDSLPSLSDKWRHRVARVAYGAYAWLAVVIITVPVCLISLVLAGRRPAWRLTHRAARWLVRVCAIPVSVNWGASELTQPHVIVANHCSYADAILVMSLLPAPHRFVAHSWLARIPLLGAWLGKLGTVFIERTEPIDSGGARASPPLDEAAARLVVFPEGTFTAVTGLRPFYLGAFEFAAAENLPVVPVALQGMRTVLRDGHVLLRRRPVRVVAGAALRRESAEDTFSAAVRMRDAARDHILRHCGEPDLGS